MLRTITANGATGVIFRLHRRLGHRGTTDCRRQLVATADANVDLRQTTNNTIGTFAAKATNGYVALSNSAQSCSIRSAPRTGSRPAPMCCFRLARRYHQTRNGIITAGGGLVLQAADGSIALDQANLLREFRRLGAERQRRQDFRT